MRRAILFGAALPLPLLAAFAACSYGQVACSAYVSRTLEVPHEVICESTACAFDPLPTVGCFEDETDYTFEPPRLTLYVYPPDTDLDGDPYDDGRWFGYMSSLDVIHTTSPRNLIHELEHARLWRETGDPDPSHASPPGPWSEITDERISTTREACLVP